MHHLQPQPRPTELESQIPGITLEFEKRCSKLSPSIWSVLEHQKYAFLDRSVLAPHRYATSQVVHLRVRNTGMSYRSVFVQDNLCCY